MSLMKAARITVTAVLLLLITAAPSWANSMPWTFVRGPGGTILPGKETAVGVVEERLTFDFGERERTSINAQPFVTVEYDLENPSASSETLRVAFYFAASQGLGYDRDFTVVWRGITQTTNLDVATSSPASSPYPLPELGPVETHWLNPKSGKVYETHPVTAEHLGMALFTITVDAGERDTLQIKYRQSASGYDRRTMSTWHYTYLLSPARQWAFFRGLTIRVQGPVRATIATEPKLERLGKKSPGVLERHFETLPDGDLHLSVRPPLTFDALVYHAFSVMTPQVLLAVTLFFLVGLFWLAQRVKSRSARPL